jgi:hypothetical protein
MLHHSDFVARGFVATEDHPMKPKWFVVRCPFFVPYLTMWAPQRYKLVYKPQ